MLKSTNITEAFGLHHVAHKYDPIFNGDNDDKSCKNATPATGKTSKKETNRLLADLGIGTWSFDVQRLLLYLSPAGYRLLNLPVEKSLNFRELLVLFIKWQQASLLPIFKQRLKSSYSFAEDLFIGPENGCEGGWFKISGKMYDNGRQVLMGTVTDITAAKTEEIPQKDLVALLNHELRTPLSIVKLYLQTSSRQAREKKYYSIEGMLTTADRQIIRMTNLMNDFLSVSLLENARLIIHPARFNLTELGREAIENMSFLFPNHQFCADFNLPVWVNADQDKILQVLNNYLVNAVKFSPENSIIHLKYKKFQNKLDIIVVDSGAGIRREDQAKLFSRYCQIHRNDPTKIKGYGLGLYLSKEIIEMHKGKVWVNSALGKGSSFGFSLPL